MIIRVMRLIKLTSAFIIFLLFAAVFSGCKFDYNDSMVAEKLEEEVPNTVLKNFTQVMVKDGFPTFYIKAEESKNFGKKKETLFSDVHFQEFDKEGVVITEGSAENAKMFNETESVEIWGSLNFYSKREEASLEGEYLFWDNEKSTLSGKKEEVISITETDGSKISGKGFFADSMTKSISFDGGVSGSWTKE